MEQLLNITRIPIKVEVKVHRGELKEVENPTGKPGSAPSVRVSAMQDGGIRMQAEPYKMNLSEVRNYDSYIPSGDNGITLTYEGIAKLADGAAKASAGGAQGGRKVSSNIEAVLQSLPKNKNSAVSYSNGTLSINYQMRNLESVAYNSERPEFEFIPGSIEFIIEQMPGLDIEYLGDPIYFPRSADPNYEPPLDVKA
ncbi:MAG: hypothetical protein J1F11_01285 [Oscillospiraceae bacterium]|nr:hypothetical protein [Oscillospiraceae bacterium]